MPTTTQPITLKLSHGDYQQLLFALGAAAGGAMKAQNSALANTFWELTNKIIKQYEDIDPACA
jgi:4-hydroxybenzoate polyprenyltransferase